jgi:hypothetical protein
MSARFPRMGKRSSASDTCLNEMYSVKRARRYLGALRLFTLLSICKPISQLQLVDMLQQDVDTSRLNDT